MHLSPNSHCYMLPQCSVHVKPVFAHAPSIDVPLSADSGANDENLCFSIARDENGMMLLENIG